MRIKLTQRGKKGRSRQRRETETEKETDFF